MCVCILCILSLHRKQNQVSISQSVIPSVNPVLLTKVSLNRLSLKTTWLSTASLLNMSLHLILLIQALTFMKPVFGLILWNPYPRFIKPFAKFKSRHSFQSCIGDSPPGWLPRLHRIYPQIFLLVRVQTFTEPDFDIFCKMNLRLWLWTHVHISDLPWRR